MNEFVVDTHALYWYLAGMPQLTPLAKAAFDTAANGKAKLLIPSIVLAELYFLNAKLGTPFDVAEEYARLKAAPQVVFIPFNADDVLTFDALNAIPEMHDRIIAGVAFSRNCPCITRDPAMASLDAVETIW
jgi:PIN domain nuclease of toxin-antitoxin system